MKVALSLNDIVQKARKQQESGKSESYTTIKLAKAEAAEVRRQLGNDEYEYDVTVTDEHMLTIKKGDKKKPKAA